MAASQAAGMAPAPNSLNLNNLASNNPFRNRAASPASMHSDPSPQSPLLNGHRPPSTNPFVDSPEQQDGRTAGPTSPPRSPHKSSRPNGTSKPKSHTNEPPFDFFERLDIHDRGPSTNGRSRHPPPSSDSVNGRHRPSRSDQDKGPGPALGPPPPYQPQRSSRRKDVFADPVEGRRPRRNSESSVAGVRDSKAAEGERDRRRREARHDKHREGRHRDGSGHHSSKSKKPNRRLDIIDKLDVTGVYGTGLFHHDGPFDACNPARNRKGHTQAPMQAFPKDSMNNALGGSGPVNKDIDRNQFYGTQGAEAFSDFSTSGRDNATYEPYSANNEHVRPGTASFNPVTRFDPVHGDDSLGLGTSTFLEGAPASRAAIQRRESQDESSAQKSSGGGLQRKMSLAQRLRGMNSTRANGRGSAGSSRVTSPEAKYEGNPATSRTKTSEGKYELHDDGPRNGKTSNETNPFFNDYDKAFESKGANIAFAEQGRSRAPSSPPRRNLERRVTHDATPAAVGSEESKPSGFLSRVKSLKGGSRRRPSERT